MNDPATQAKKVEAIRSLTAAGFTLFPLEGTSKEPRRGLLWRDVKHGQFGEKELANSNYAVALGETDLVLDWDPRRFAEGDNEIKRFTETLGVTLDTFIIQSGGGGLHIYLKIPKGFSCVGKLKAFAGLDIKKVGGYLVAPGSIHPDTGNPYKILRKTPAAIAPAPQSLLTLITKQEIVFGADQTTGTFINDEQTKKRYADWLKSKAPPSIEGHSGDATAFSVAARGRDFALSADVTLELMLEFWNERSTPPWSESELREKVSHAYRYANNPIGNAHPSLDFKDIPTYTPTVQTTTAQVPAEEAVPKLPTAPKGDEAPSNDITLEPFSVDDFALSQSGVVLKNFHNLINYLKSPNTGISGLFSYNEFTTEMEFSNPAPWHRGKLPFSVALTDADIKLIKAHLASRLAFERSTTEIEEALNVVARHKRFHPVREYLEGLKWDGVPRLDFWLRDYLGAEDTELNRAYARKTLCAAVARIMRPGCKFDYVLILEGDQGVGKSEVCRILGGDWAADFVIDPNNKDTIQYMQGKWIIELPDLGSHKIADINSWKAFLTRRSDKVRLAYGRLAVEYPRQSIFIGSFNPGADGTYLKDDTGNRRYWSVKCNPTGPRGKVDFKKFKAVRHQLWAEAVERMKGKDAELLYMENQDLEDAAAESIKMRHAEHPWTERIGSWLDGLKLQKGFVTAREVFIDALGGIDKQLDTRTMRGIASALKALGWKTDVKKIGARSVRGYSTVLGTAAETENSGIEDLI